MTASVIAGGMFSTVRSGTSAIGGGEQNLIRETADHSVIAGGYQNAALPGATYSAVLGGKLNSVSASCAIAAGQRAKAQALGSFVWADSTALDYAPLGYSAAGGINNSFNLRASGGVYFATAVNSSTGEPTAGTYVSSGGSGWNTYCDRDAKTNFSDVDATDTVMVYWPSPSTGFNPQVNTNLATTNWVTPAETVQDNGSIKYMLVSPPAGNRFYRLKNQ